MKREDVTKIFADATDEQISALLDINSTDIGKAKKDGEKYKADLDTLKREAEQHKQTIADLEAKAKGGEDLAAELEKLKKDIAEKEETTKKESADKALTDAIIAAFPTDKEFTSEYVKNGLVADIKAKHAEDGTKGIAAIFDELTKDKEGIFKSMNPAGDMAGVNGNITISGDDTMRIAMGLPPLAEKK